MKQYTIEFISRIKIIEESKIKAIERAVSNEDKDGDELGWVFVDKPKIIKIKEVSK